MVDEILAAYTINFNRGGGVVPLGGKSETYFRRSKRFIYIYIHIYVFTYMFDCDFQSFAEKNHWWETKQRNVFLRVQKNVN